MKCSGSYTHSSHIISRGVIIDYHIVIIGN